MTRLFHAVCALALIGSFARVELSRAAPAPPDRIATLEHFLGRRGIGFLHAKQLFENETVLSFRNPACAEPLKILYLPALYNMSGAARALIARASHVVFVQDGAIAPSLSPVRLIPRWLWRRALVDLGLASDDWTSVALVLLPAGGCRAPAIDWGALLSASSPP